MSSEEIKRAVGYEAAKYIEDGMIVGIGTGTTAHYFIERLAQLCKEGLSIQAISSSEKSHREAIGIPMIDYSEVTHIDITVDGADEIDPEKQMIKGGGGALLREKIVASASREMIVIVDESKCVKKLGKHPLPVEILPFAYRATIAHINTLGYEGSLRAFTTDSGNYIIDIKTSNPEKAHSELIDIPGVIETGFFANIANKVLVGHANGSITKL